MSDKNDKSIFKMFTPVGKKIHNIIVGLFVVAGVLFVIDVFGLRQDCKPSQSQDKFTCVCSDIFTQFYASFFTAALSIWGVELALREETVKEIGKIFNLSEAIKGIEAFYDNKTIYHDIVKKTIEKLGKEETLRILLLPEDIGILGFTEARVIKEKIRQKCQFQILVINPSPDSRLMSGLNQMYNINMSSSLEGQLSNFCQSFPEELVRDSKNNLAINGSLEIRFYDVFSPVGYLSGENINMAWTYLFDADGPLQHPSFKISENNQTLINAARNHFDKLWLMSENPEQIALRSNRSGKYVNRYRSDGENSSRT